jgi:phage/plasmid-like protein (TIGR03299 family)
MAHNINFNENTGKHSFFSVKEMAWHGLGRIVEQYPNSKDAISHAGLDYQVEKADLIALIKKTTNQHESGSAPVPGYFATMRMDNNAVLGVVGKDYQIVQNRDAFTFFDSIVGNDGILYETAGALGKGERIFITAKLPGYIQVGSDDLIEKYLFLTTSHDGSGSITAAFTPVRIVCANTLNAAMKNMTNVVKIRHTSNAVERLRTAHKVMGIANKFSDEVGEIFNDWAKKPITDPQLKKLIEIAMAPNRDVLGNLRDGKINALSTQFTNIVDDVYEYALTNPTQQLPTTMGTVFGAYNAVAGYFQNVRKFQDDEAKVKSILLGGTAQLRAQTTFNLCADFAKNGISSLNLN